MSREINTAKTNQVTLEDNTRFFYSINPFELKNALGSTVAILQEFSFTKNPESTDQVCYKLYKTKEGNWYDIHDLKSSIDYTILRRLKAGMDNSKTALPRQL
ncbi:MAG: hypothetical protein JWO92_1142 [Chitinophagaceae bacterium]|nr:hypothetical protein [Chitinophagaceae bacterium]